MEILLLEDLPGVGKKNDLLIVGDGYAMNKLLPNRMALVATPTVRRRYAEEIKRRAVEKVAETAAAQAGGTKIQGKSITVAKKATKTGKLYAAVSEKVLAEEMMKQLSVSVKPEAITIAEPIKALGTHSVIVTLAGIAHAMSVEVTQEK
ncbi:50S ribosomal protein L9 [Candidatus Peregrinibacteria bacterium CG10_big_fil_rev_8_21_14_0_10_49_10]|nr:MAG: 50S ribosomal protein L9 [Candidatus Peregrinibacteria bacterium CG10_big_fil_rev_8_21_14_0_10_49_10]